MVGSKCLCGHEWGVLALQQEAFQDLILEGEMELEDVIKGRRSAGGVRTLTIDRLSRLGVRVICG